MSMCITEWSEANGYTDAEFAEHILKIAAIVGGDLAKGDGVSHIEFPFRDTETGESILVSFDVEEVSASNDALVKSLEGNE